MDPYANSSQHHPPGEKGKDMAGPPILVRRKALKEWKLRLGKNDTNSQKRTSTFSFRKSREEGPGGKRAIFGEKGEPLLGGGSEVLKKGHPSKKKRKNKIERREEVEKDKSRTKR